MILVDTSAWVEFLRATGSPVHLRMRTLLDDEAPLCTTEVVVMEILAGARDEERAASLQRLLARHELLAVHGLSDYETAAQIFRRSRSRGATIRNLTDCLIAAVAVREQIPVLHRDRDFDQLAEHTALQVAS